MYRLHLQIKKSKKLTTQKEAFHHEPGKENLHTDLGSYRELIRIKKISKNKVVNITSIYYNPGLNRLSVNSKF